MCKRYGNVSSGTICLPIVVTIQTQKRKINRLAYGMMIVAPIIHLSYVFCYLVRLL